MTATPEQRFCSECGRQMPADELARFGDHVVCPVCKETFVQRLREGASSPVSIAAARNYAGFWIRLLASILDGIILGIVSGAVNLLIFGSLFPRGFRPDPNQTPEEALAAMAPLLAAFGLSFLVGLAFSCAYETFFVARIGATPGKMALGLKVVRADGSPVTTGRAVARYFSKKLSDMTLGVGYILAGFDSEKRAMHDMICDTRVVRSQG